MKLGFAFPDCSWCGGKWEVVGDLERTEVLQRRRLRCTTCKARKVVTVTFATDRAAPTDPASVIPLRPIR